MIKVTKTFLPPIEEYTQYLAQIWQREWITNHGPCVTELECKLKDYLQVKHLFLVNNGTIALQIAIKALDLRGEIITTPFSYVATTSSIAWENCIPVFADIDRGTLCIDPVQIEKKITEKTSAILATHVYGNPCNVKSIEELAQKYNLKVIYDAAHAFGVEHNQRNILQWGDISTLSFHATKVFHTVEGGAIVTDNDEKAHRIEYMRNFGHETQESFFGIGVNGKVSEFHAAMGLVNLKHFENILASRKEVFSLYDNLLFSSEIIRPSQPKGLKYNYAYYPVIFKSEEIATRIKARLNLIDVFPRRYFYPSLNRLPYVKYEPTPVSEDICSRILCLPLYVGLKADDIERICVAINEGLNDG
jgi:dTDP-4-amino-4,6-dideoxygalactose transaminase